MLAEVAQKSKRMTLFQVQDVTWKVSEFLTLADFLQLTLTCKISSLPVTSCRDKWILFKLSLKKNLDFTTNFLQKNPSIDPSNNRHHPYQSALEIASIGGHLPLLDLLLSDIRINPCEKFNFPIMEACKNGHHLFVSKLSREKRVDLSLTQYNQIFSLVQCASMNGQHKTVAHFLNYNIILDLSNTQNLALRKAAQNGHHLVVALLLSDGRADPSAKNNEAVRFSAENGHRLVLEILLRDERVDPGADDSSAIQYASMNGHYEIVELLLMDLRVNPRANDDYAIKMARKYGHHTIVDLLTSYIR